MKRSKISMRRNLTQPAQQTLPGVPHPPPDTMRLWLLHPHPEHERFPDDPWEPWYDKAFGFVVRAENEQQAREMAQARGGDEKFSHPTAWTDPRLSTCIELTAKGLPGVILRDFSAS